MHVSSYPRVLAMLGLLACCAGSAQAVEFDEKIKAPMVKEVAALRTQAQSYVEKFAEVQADPAAIFRDRALAAERFDLSWQIQRAIDVRRPLGDLSAIGLEPWKDGSYRIDFNAWPQWERPDEKFGFLLAGPDWQSLGEVLISRGFREADVATLKKYLATHDFQRDARRESLPLTLSFTKIVKKYDKIKRPVDDAVVLSYIYQRAKLNAERGREWAEGILNSLDAQRSRILLAVIDESQSIGIWAPSDQRAGIDEQLRLMRLPDFEQLATADAFGDAP